MNMQGAEHSWNFDKDACSYSAALYVVSFLQCFARAYSVRLSQTTKHGHLWLLNFVQPVS